jgi:hypothetical protein
MHVPTALLPQPIGLRPSPAQPPPRCAYEAPIHTQAHTCAPNFTHGFQRRVRTWARILPLGRAELQLLAAGRQPREGWQAGCGPLRRAGPDLERRRPLRGAR